jgi:putative peptidoglycan lipid II flippase
MNSLFKSTATIGGFTLISRILGFARDVTIAASLGASQFSDAFFVAFKLPNYLRRLFAEGAFNSAFVPMYTGMLAEGDENKAKQFASEAMSFLLVILLGVTALFMIFMPQLMTVLAPGFSDDPEKFALTVTLTRITMPYIIFISLVSLLGGILNSSDKFAAVAATPVIMNICLIVIPFFIDPITQTGAHSLAIAVATSGVAQWLWLVYFCYKRGMLPRLVRPRLTPDVKKLLILIAPVALGAGVAQINLFIDTIIASYFDSGVSYLYYADRINELPLAVIGIAVGTALLPMLSRQIREGKIEEASKSQNRAIILSLLLSIPATIALVIMAEPIITVMFQRGAFGAVETAATYKALIAFALGLPAFILVKIIAPAFFARQDTKTPFKIALVCIAVNLFFNLTLMWSFKHVGMALATSIAGWVNVVLMVIVLRKRNWLVFEKKLWGEVARIIIASIIMAIALFAARETVDSYMHTKELVRFTILMVFVSGGIMIYGITAITLNIMNSRSYLKQRLQRK